MLSHCEPRRCQLEGVTIMENVGIRCRQEVLWAGLTAGGKNWLLSADYKNFNIQHCIHLMSYIWTSIARQYSDLFGSNLTPH